MKKKLSFVAKNYKPNNKIIFIAGTCRSGKTTLGQILSSGKYCGLNEEEYILQKFNLLYQQEIGMRDYLQEIFEYHIDEIYHDVILCRNANFRKNDLSSIYKNTLKSELKYRMNLDGVRDAAEYNKKFKFKLIQILTESVDINNLFKNMKCKPLGVLNIIGHYNQVSTEIANKKWFLSKNFKGSNLFLATREYKINKSKYYLPWWVKNGDEEYFLDLNLFSRGLYYWYVINKRIMLSKNTSTKYKTYNIFYDDIKHDTNIIKSLMSEYKIKSTSLTKNLLNDIVSRSNTNHFYPHRADRDLLDKCQKLYIDLMLYKYEI